MPVNRLSPGCHCCNQPGCECPDCGWLPHTVYSPGTICNSSFENPGATFKVTITGLTAIPRSHSRLHFPESATDEDIEFDDVPFSLVDVVYEDDFPTRDLFGEDGAGLACYDPPAVLASNVTLQSTAQSNDGTAYDVAMACATRVVPTSWTDALSVSSFLVSGVRTVRVIVGFASSGSITSGSADTQFIDIVGNECQLVQEVTENLDIVWATTSRGCVAGTSALSYPVTVKLEYLGIA